MPRGIETTKHRNDRRTRQKKNAQRQQLATSGADTATAQATPLVPQATVSQSAEPIPLAATQTGQLAATAIGAIGPIFVSQSAAAVVQDHSESTASWQDGEEAATNTGISLKDQAYAAWHALQTEAATSRGRPLGIAQNGNHTAGRSDGGELRIDDYDAYSFDDASFKRPKLSFDNPLQFSGGGVRVRSDKDTYDWSQNGQPGFPHDWRLVRDGLDLPQEDLKYLRRFLGSGIVQPSTFPSGAPIVNVSIIPEEYRGTQPCIGWLMGLLADEVGKKREAKKGRKRVQEAEETSSKSEIGKDTAAEGTAVVESRADTTEEVNNVREDHLDKAPELKSKVCGIL